MAYERLVTPIRGNTDGDCNIPVTISTLTKHTDFTTQHIDALSLTTPLIPTLTLYIPPFPYNTSHRSGLAQYERHHWHRQ
jgi:hypothetical protein